MEILIRSAVMGDLDDLLRRRAEFMSHHIARDARFTLRPGAEDAWPEQIRRAIDDPDSLVSAAIAGPDLVGCAYTLIRPGAMDYGSERIGYLCDVFVDPDHRRSGLARRFLEVSVDWLRERGIGTIETTWAICSQEACSTWPGLGFVPISTCGRIEF